MQLLSALDGTPLRVIDAGPGSVNDISVAREHSLPELYKTAADGPPTLADCGYQEADIGIHHPFNQPQENSHQRLHPYPQTCNALLQGVQALGEQTAAELKERWRALQ
ncbi:transposase family protein [Streptomyces sp. NPDC055085]